MAISLGLFTALAVLEAVFPRRERQVARGLRWPNNVGIALVDGLIMRILLPTSAVSFGVLAEASGCGLLQWVALPGWLEVVLAVVILDLAIYGQHVLFHYVPALWRLHRMHHADLDFDVTTGSRFHPLEVLISFGIKFVVVVALGASPLAVLIFEVLLNGTSLFNHSNLRLPASLDRVARLIVVTPDMHRVHHSVVSRETNSNFGFNLPWWDRLFHTYRAQPEAGHDRMTIGLTHFREPRELWIDRMLTQPFRHEAPPAQTRPAPPANAHE